MNISDVNASTHRSDQLKSAHVGGIDPASRSRRVADEQTEAGSDRVEISHDAHKALSEARTTEELTFARRALQSVPEMSEQRTAELQDRIKSGYYSQPEALEMIAQRLSAEIGSR